MMIGRKDAELHPHLPRNPLGDCLPTHIKEGHLWNEHMLKYANACGNPSSSRAHKKKPHLHEGEKGMDPQISPKDGSDMSHFLSVSHLKWIYRFAAVLYHSH